MSDDRIGMVPERYRADLGRSFALDAMIARENSAATLALLKFDSAGLIILRSSDVLHLEVNNTPHEVTRVRSQARIAPMPMNRGAIIIGSTGRGGLIGGPADERLYDDGWGVMWPHCNRFGKSDENARRRRDTQHVCTAIRYGENAFITRDGEGRKRGILDSAAEIEARWGLQIMRPEPACEFVCRLFERYLVRAPDDPRRGLLTDTRRLPS